MHSYALNRSLKLLKVVQLQGQSSLDQGLCPWIPLWVLSLEPNRVAFHVLDITHILKRLASPLCFYSLLLGLDSNNKRPFAFTQATNQEG